MDSHMTHSGGPERQHHGRIVVRAPDLAIAVRSDWLPEVGRLAFVADDASSNQRRSITGSPNNSASRVSRGLKPARLVEILALAIADEDLGAD